MDKFLIVGLGNIGEKYVNTRHNVGFMIMDNIAQKFKLVFSSARYGDMAVFNFKGKKFILLKPSTFMNLSGKAVRYWLVKERIEINNLLVVTDDIALSVGSIRMKKKGADGGHNGLNNIIFELGTNEFPRLRFGIGNDFSKGYQIDYVLSKWDEEEFKLIKPRIDFAGDAVISFATSGIDNTMNLFNNK